MGMFRKKQAAASRGFTSTILTGSSMGSPDVPKYERPKSLLGGAK
jgi:hypothetical protein